MAEDHSEIVVALVAAVGTDVGMVAEEVAAELSAYDFESEVFRLSEYLAEQAENDFRGLPLDEYIWEGMSEGDRLRQRWERGDALALSAISDIVATREERADEVVEFTQEGVTEEFPKNLDRFAFILRSLKTPDELQTLRAVYGPRLVVIGAYSPYDRRVKHLADTIGAERGNHNQATWSHSPEELIARDEKEEVTGGQALRDTFHRADFFIRAWDRDIAKKDIKRTLEVLFGHPFRTPTRDESGQFHAQGAALRSSELGRQVGAAITTTDGSVIAVGTNEVPRFGGGSPWEDEEGTGIRDFELLGHDSNRKQFDDLAERISAEVGSTLRELVDEVAGEEGECIEALKEVHSKASEVLPAALRKGGLKDLTEFGRAVHAEMNAMLDAARRGVSVRGATLYTTTFPCHNCARHIIGAGIERVVFVEPYAKSRAEVLHAESIVIAQSEAAAGKVVFEPFVGVAPIRYLEMFDAAGRERMGHTARHQGDGKANEFAKTDASPVFVDGPRLGQFKPELPAYRAKESLALEHLERLEAAGAGEGQDGSEAAKPPADEE